MKLRQSVAAWIMAGLALLLVIGGACADEPAVTERPADTMRGEKAGQERDDNGLKMKFVWCPPGIFEMGKFEEKEVVVVAADDEEDRDESDPLVEGEDEPREAADNEPPTVEVIRPVKVFLTRGYWLGKYEVTQREWKQVMQTEPWRAEKLVKEGDDFPATYVAWDDAVNFCRKLTQREREAGRLPDVWEYSLPTEAQWERACRARTNTTYHFGDDESQLDEYAWFDKNVGGDGFAHRVGQKKSNPWGLHDMHGNVWEWCRDAFNDNLSGGRDPEMKEGLFRASRGGCWGSPAVSCQSAYRLSDLPSLRLDSLGFRVALSSVQPVQPASGAGSGDPEGARR